MEPIADLIKKLVATLDHHDPATAFKAESELARLAWHAGAPDKTKECAAIATALAAELNAETTVKERNRTRTQPVHTAKARRYICRCLSYVGDEAVVPALEKAIDDLDVREMARFALERNPSAAATQALIKALDALGTDFRIGVVNTLGRRGSPDAAAALVKAAESEQGELRMTAAEALANYPTVAHYEVIAAAANTDAPRARDRTNRARIRLAETLRKAGQKRAAESAYRLLRAEKLPPAQAKAVKIGIAAIPRHRR